MIFNCYLVALCVLCELCVSVVDWSFATGYNQTATDYHHRDTERTEDSQRTRLFYHPLENSEEPSRRCWRWRHARSRPGAEEGRRSSIWLGTTAVSREGAGGGPGDRLRDRDAGAAWGRIINDPKETCPTGAAEECLLGAGYRGGSGRGVGDGGEAGEGLMV